MGFFWRFADCITQMLNDPQNDVSTTRATEERRSGKTAYCGVFSEGIKTPKKARRDEGKFFCVICDSQFTRRASVNYHFPSCVRKYGNPLANRWDDHGSCRNQEVSNAAPANYDPNTIVSDLLRVMGEHPFLPPLNAHMLGRRLDHEPTARTSVHPQRVDQDRELSTEPTISVNQQSHGQNETDGEADKMRAKQEATVAQANAGEEKGDAKGMSGATAVEESTTPTRSSQPIRRENPSDHSTLSQTRGASQLGALPHGWGLYHFDTGVEYFLHHYTGIITVDDPRVVPQVRPLTRLGGMPNGWEICVGGNAAYGFQAYFVDHNTRTATWNDPRRP